MVKQVKRQGGKYYQCEKCEFIYEDRGWAEECEKWCKENNSCNIEITKHSIKMKGGIKNKDG